MTGNTGQDTVAAEAVDTATGPGGADAVPVVPVAPPVPPAEPVAPTPSPQTGFWHGVRKVLIHSRLADGLLFLMGVMVTASIPFLVDRRNSIDRHASASIAVVDQALQTALNFSNGPTAGTVEQQLTTLRFLHFFGEYQVEDARPCLDLLIADVDRLSQGALPERPTAAGGAPLTPHEALFEDALILKSRIRAWQQAHRVFSAAFLSPRTDFFATCFRPLEQ